MAFDFPALKAEVVGDPLARGYAAMTPADVAASLAARTRPSNIPARDVRKYMMLGGVWARVKMLANAPATGTAALQAKAVAMTAIDALTGAFDEFDVLDPAVAAPIGAMLDGLVAAMVMQQSDKVAILALGDNTRTRAEEIGIGVPTAHEVSVAMGIFV